MKFIKFRVRGPLPAFFQSCRGHGEADPRQLGGLEGLSWQGSRGRGFRVRKGRAWSFPSFDAQVLAAPAGSPIDGLWSSHRLWYSFASPVYPHAGMLKVRPKVGGSLQNVWKQTGNRNKRPLGLRRQEFGPEAWQRSVSKGSSDFRFIVVALLVGRGEATQRGLH